MEKGKLIVIEGTDCSGKQTQSDLLRDKLLITSTDLKYVLSPTISSNFLVAINLVNKSKLNARKTMIKHK